MDKEQRPAGFQFTSLRKTLVLLALVVCHFFTPSLAVTLLLHFVAKLRILLGNWEVCDEVSTTFTKLSERPLDLDEEDQSHLEKFVVTMYDRSSTSSYVNKARLELFARKQQSYMAIPPTQALLKQHTKRAVYQGGIIWGQTMNARPSLPSPANYG